MIRLFPKPDSIGKMVRCCREGKLWQMPSVPRLCRCSCVCAVTQSQCRKTRSSCDPLAMDEFATLALLSAQFGPR